VVNHRHLLDNWLVPHSPNRAILILMPPHKLSPEIISAAIVGFEQQKLRLDTQIAELRALRDGARPEPVSTPEVPKGKRRKMSAALWLMILQRLHAGATLAAAVQLLIQGAAGTLLQRRHRYTWRPS
jgi:hypothetical protein